MNKKLYLTSVQIIKLLTKFTQKQLANILEVSERTIRRHLKPSNKPLKKVGRKPKINSNSLNFLRFYTTFQKTTTQNKLARYLSISQPTICRALKKIGITYKKATYQSSEQLNQQEKIEHFVNEIILSLSQSNVFFLDECSFHLNEAPRWGYSPKGSRVITQRPGERGKNYTLIFLIQINDGEKLIHSKLIEGGMKTEDFHQFLTEFTPPNDGKKNYLLMDNLPVHKAKQSCLKLGLTTIEELLTSKNIEIIFLPPYTPEINPVEKIFNITRQHIEKGKPRIKEKLICLIEEKIKFFKWEDFIKYLDNSIKECLMKVSSIKETEPVRYVIDKEKDSLEQMINTLDLAKITLNMLANSN
jgi:transposase